jgi:hypothetical protein
VPPLSKENKLFIRSVSLYIIYNSHEFSHATHTELWLEYGRLKTLLIWCGAIKIMHVCMFCSIRIAPYAYVISVCAEGKMINYGIFYCWND